MHAPVGEKAVALATAKKAITVTAAPPPSGGGTTPPPSGGARPRRLPVADDGPGRDSLEATYEPAGGVPVTGARKIRLTGRRPARRATAGSRPGVALGRGPRALPDGRFHGDRPARRFSVR